MFEDDTVLVVSQGTLSGKTLLVDLARFFRRGVTLFLEPLVGLASDQVDRATMTEHNFICRDSDHAVC